MSSTKWLPLASMSPGRVPAVSRLWGSISKINRWVGPEVFSNYWLCSGAQSVWDFLHAFFKSRASLSYNLLALQYVSIPDLKARHHGGSPSQCRTPRLSSRMWHSDPWLLGRTPAVVIILPFVGCLTRIMGCDCSSCMSLWDAFLISLTVENQVVLIDGSSVVL